MTKDHFLHLLSQAVRTVCEVVNGSQAWILDVDLDFFSTNNPFKIDFTDVAKLIYY